MYLQAHRGGYRQPEVQDNKGWKAVLLLLPPAFALEKDWHYESLLTNMCDMD